MLLHQTHAHKSRSAVLFSRSRDQKNTWKSVVFEVWSDTIGEVLSTDRHGVIQVDTEGTGLYLMVCVSISKVLKADTNTNRVIGFSSSKYLTNGHPETTTTGFNLVPGT